MAWSRDTGWRLSSSGATVEVPTAVPAGGSRRVTFVQFGPYAEAVRRLAAGGRETFYAQQYSVDAVARLATELEDVTVLHLSDDAPEERLPNGVRSLGLRLYPAYGRPRHDEVLRTLERLEPDSLIVCTPSLPVLAWALGRGIRTLPLFADSFHAVDWRSRLKFSVLAGLLNQPRIEWVSNHNLAASMDLVRIGVRAEKVLPFDWPALWSPADRPPRSLREGVERSVIYVGQVNAGKGVGDLLAALAKLSAAAGPGRWRATIVGGRDAALVQQAAALGLQSSVAFVGRVPHAEVVPLMAAHDVVVVPSRAEHPEGLPMTIYEGLCSRTPIVASDHPMFRLKLKDRQTALLFKAGDPDSLAAQLEALSRDAALYAKLSHAAEEAGRDFFCPLKFDELITRWLRGMEDDQRALSRYALSTGRYHDGDGGGASAPKAS